MDGNASSWDKVHQRIHVEDKNPSSYAQEKEILFPRGAIVADLGGGTGADALYFLDKDHQVIILDVSKFALEVAQKKATEAGKEKNLITKEVDFGEEKLPLRDNSCDVVYSRISLNYFPRDRTVEIFREIYNCLKRGGRAFITLKSPRDREEITFLQSSSVVFEPGVFIQNGQLRSRFTETQLKEMLNEADIRGYEVKLYDENLTHKGEGHKDMLHLTEITFTKQESS